MFPGFSRVIAAIDDLKTQGLIEDYAIFGAMAQLFWDEAIPTFDLDVLVLLVGQTGPLIDLGPIYEWARARGYEEQGAHFQIGGASGMPVQFIPAAPDPLSEEAVSAAATKEVDGVPVKVVRPEYLIALWLQPPANDHRRKERAAKLRQSGQVDEELLRDLMARYNLSW
jgi:hypothetical protein